MNMKVRDSHSVGVKDSIALIIGAVALGVLIMVSVPDSILWTIVIKGVSLLTLWWYCHRQPMEYNPDEYLDEEL